MDNPQIRQYQPTDREAVFNILRLNTPEYFSPEEEKDLVHYLDNELEYYYVIEVDKRVVGSGGFNFAGDPTTGIISWDMLHPEYQGKSFGSYLLNYRIAKLQQFETLQKIIVRTSQMSWKFYEKRGFGLQEIVRNYWADGFDLYRMEYGK